MSPWQALVKVTFTRTHLHSYYMYVCDSDLPYSGERLCGLHGDQPGQQWAGGGEGGPGGGSGQCDGQDWPGAPQPPVQEIDICTRDGTTAYFILNIYLYHCVTSPNIYVQKWFENTDYHIIHIHILYKVNKKNGWLIKFMWFEKKIWFSEDAEPTHHPHTFILLIKG